VDKPTVNAILIALLPFLIAGWWCFVVWILSVMGGWRRLAAQYRARRPPTGRRLSMQSGKIGFVNYNGCLTIHASDDGLWLSVMALFRPGHPPLLIPWSKIHNRQTRRIWGRERVAFEVGSPATARLQLPAKVFEGQDATK
jgi:hypothetical protein